MSESPDGLQIRWVDAELQALSLHPGDTLVLRHPEKLSPHHLAALWKHLTTLFPGHQVIVLDHGMGLEVLRPEGEAGERQVS